MVEIDDNTPRGSWKKVLIKSIIPSDDGLIRKVIIQDSEQRNYTRPITRLIPIRVQTSWGETCEPQVSVG